VGIRPWPKHFIDRSRISNHVILKSQYANNINLLLLLIAHCRVFRDARGKLIAVAIKLAISDGASFTKNLWDLCWRVVFTAIYNSIFRCLAQICLIISPMSQCHYIHLETCFSIKNITNRSFDANSH